MLVIGESVMNVEFMYASHFGTELKRRIMILLVLVLMLVVFDHPGVKLYTYNCARLMSLTVLCNQNTTSIV